MTATEELKSLQNEALASLGRNVLHFQRLEFGLRLLLSLFDYEGHPTEFAQFLKKRARKLRKASLGAMAEEWSIRFFQSDAPSNTEKELPDSYMTLSFRADTAPEHSKEIKRQLRSLVAERNRLIHHDLAAFDPTLAESCRTLTAFLDEQNKRVLSQIKTFDQLRSAAAAQFKALFDSLRSNDPNQTPKRAAFDTSAKSSGTTQPTPKKRSNDEPSRQAAQCAGKTGGSPS